MSQTATHRAETSEEELSPVEEAEASSSTTSGSTFAARRERLFTSIGLVAAPVLILLLAFGLFLYYQSLDIGGSAAFGVSSALDWSTKLQPQLIAHLEISAFSSILVILIAVPLGVLLTRPALRRLAPFILTVANSGQAIPAYGLLAIFLILKGPGQSSVVIALALFALLPVLRNTMVGLDAVDRNVIEAGRGMGMTKMGALLRIELPLAVPVIVAGVRIAVIINIGMATLAFLIGGGGLGITIGSGLKNQQDPVIIVSSVMVALVALTFDWLGALAERYLKPKGI